MKKKMQNRPPEGSTGAHTARREPREGTDGDEDAVGDGAEVAPTAKAEQDQRARHAKEASSARIAARAPGKQGNSR